MFFKKNKPPISVSEVKLQKQYIFMYENFIVASQHKLILILEQTGSEIDTLQFDFLAFKYGYPNDEVSHPLSKYGMGVYGFYKVDNSPWLAEIIKDNRQHSRHSEEMF